MRRPASRPPAGRAAEAPRGENRILATLGLVVRLVAAAFWIFAGAVKIADLSAFQQEVARYDLLPQVLVAPVAYLLPFLEAGVGVYLAVGLLVRGAALAGTALLACFLAAQVWAMATGIVLDCGCFGPILARTVSPFTVLRDFCLGIPTFLMLAFPARRCSLDRRLFGAANLFGGAASRRSAA